jgi:hypothetical protein
MKKARILSLSSGDRESPGLRVGFEPLTMQLENKQESCN